MINEIHVLCQIGIRIASGPSDKLRTQCRERIFISHCRNHSDEGCRAARVTSHWVPGWGHYANWNLFERFIFISQDLLCYSVRENSIDHFLLQ